METTDAADRNLARRKGVRARQKKLPRGWSLATVLVSFLVFFVFVSGRESIFTLDGVTERASIELTDARLAQWRLPRARLLDDPFGDPAEGAQLHDASLMLETGTRVQSQRQGIGVLRLQLTADTGESVGSILEGTEPARSLGDWAVLVVELDERPLILPFRGVLIAGDDVTAGVESILLSGRIGIVEAQLAGETHYLAGEQQLDPGDRVQFLARRGSAFWGAAEWGPAVIDGFVRVEPGAFSEAANAMSIVAHGRADHVRVERLGSAGYRIRAPFWARFLNDPLIAGFTTMLALLLLLFEFSLKLHELFGSERSEDEDPSEQGGRRDHAEPVDGALDDGALDDGALDDGALDDGVADRDEAGNPAEEKVR